MKTVDLFSNGIQVRALGLDACDLHKCSFLEGVAVVQGAIEHGFNFIQTARAAISSEAMVGKAISGLREKVVVSTKTNARTVELVSAELDTSLRNLQTDYIDVYQLQDVNRLETLQRLTIPGGVADFLLREKARGNIQLIGLSTNVIEMALAAVETGIFDIVAIPYDHTDGIFVNQLVPVIIRRKLALIVTWSLPSEPSTSAEVHLRWCLEKIPGVIVASASTIGEIERLLAAAG